jgi:hypothetical protein
MNTKLMGKLGLGAVCLLVAFPAFAVVNLSIDALISAVIYLVVVGIILWLLLWLVDNLPVLAPFAQVAKMIIYVVAVLILIGILLSFIGHPIFNLR